MKPEQVEWLVQGHPPGGWGQHAGHTPGTCFPAWCLTPTPQAVGRLPARPAGILMKHTSWKIVDG